MGKPQKIGDTWYLIGTGLFCTSITEYKEVGGDEKNIKLERINSDKFRVFGTPEEAQKYLDEMKNE